MLGCLRAAADGEAEGCVCVCVCVCAEDRATQTRQKTDCNRRGRLEIVMQGRLAWAHVMMMMMTMRLMLIVRLQASLVEAPPLVHDGGYHGSVQHNDNNDCVRRGFFLRARVEVGVVPTEQAKTGEARACCLPHGLLMGACCVVPACSAMEVSIRGGRLRRLGLDLSSPY
ncbi:hypothetical protein ACJBU6_00577 [Exserohilum turcicum]